MLTREEVERRLEEKVEGTKRLVATGREREALQTAQSLYAELDAKDAEIERLREQLDAMNLRNMRLDAAPEGRESVMTDVEAPDAE